MSSSRTPPHKTVTRLPSLGPSFASCFGATVPVSPRRASHRALLAGQARVNYRRLQFDEYGEGDQCGYEDGATTEHLYNQHFVGGAVTAKLGKNSSFRERLAGRSEVMYESEGEKEIGRGRKGVLKLGKQRGKGRNGRGLSTKNAMSESAAEEGYENGERQAKDEGEDQVTRELYDKSGKEMRVKIKGSKRDKGLHVEAGESPRWASFGTRVREACVQVLETARRGSPHLSELFVGNQLLMQVTSTASFSSRHAKSMVAHPYGLHVFTNHPSSSVNNLVSSPARSTS